MDFVQQLGLSIPLVQAPMAGTSTPAMAAAVSNAGALGSIAVGAVDAAGARAMIAETRARTDRPFNVNLFTHQPARPDAAREAAWIAWLAPLFAQYGATPPVTLRPVYKSFVEDPAMLAMLVETRPAVVSFHFGLPSAEAIAALHADGIVLMATATNAVEGHAIQAAGVDVIVAQGFEAGGHRGVFDPAAPDEELSTLALTRLLLRETGLPVIAAGGIMDGAGIATVLGLGAAAAQLGTAFVACPESGADAAYRAALMEARDTTMTALISGRPARAVLNRFTALADNVADRQPPDYPIAYDAGKALNAAAKAAGEQGFGAQWAGQGVAQARSLPAAELVEALRREWQQARAQAF